MRPYNHLSALLALSSTLTFISSSSSSSSTFAHAAAAASSSPSTTFTVLHKLPDATEFTTRGKLIYNGIFDPPTFVDGVDAKDEQRLKDVERGDDDDDDRSYQVAVRMMTTTIDGGGKGGEAKESLSGTKICMLRAADWTDEFSIHVDEKSRPYHVEYTALARSCDRTSTEATLAKFKTSVKVIKTVKGARPLEDLPVAARPKVVYDTDGKIKQPEPEKSFIQKYWMYIVPVLMLFLLGPSEPPTKEEGGAAAAAPAK